MTDDEPYGNREDEPVWVRQTNTSDAIAAVFEIFLAVLTLIVLLIKAVVLGIIWIVRKVGEHARTKDVARQPSRHR